MINFRGLVLGPAMATFARPIVVTPLASQPAAPAYAARGIWDSKPIDVAMEGGGMLSTQAHTLGISSADFAVLPAQGDRIVIPAVPAMGLEQVGAYCLVEDVDADGQGGFVLSVKVIEP